MIPHHNHFGLQASLHHHKYRDFAEQLQYQSRYQPDESEDDLGTNALTVFQKKTGYRYNEDSFHLFHFIPPKERPLACDLGCGNGIIALLLLHYNYAQKVVGIEIRWELYELSVRNMAVNGFTERTFMLHGDVRQHRKIFLPEEFDLAVCNPPYYREGAGRVSPHNARRQARSSLTLNIEDIAQVSSFILKTKGKLYTLLPAMRLEEWIMVLNQHRLRPKRLRFIHPQSKEPAKLVLLEAAKNGLSGLIVEEPLFLD